MTKSVFAKKVRARKLEWAYDVDSAAVSSEEIGNPVHPGTQQKLARQIRRALEEKDITDEIVFATTTQYQVNAATKTMKPWQTVNDKDDGLEYIIL